MNQVMSYLDHLYKKKELSVIQYILAKWLETSREVMNIIFPEGLIQNLTEVARERTRLLMVSWVT